MTTVKTSLPPRTLRSLFARLKRANAAFNRARPGDPSSRQPVHTVYGGAHLFKADTAHRLGELALRALEDSAPDAATFASAVGLPAALAEKVYTRVQDKLRSEPVEDFRLDFEDGYGNRPDDEEDKHALQAATEVSKGIARECLPPFLGIRIKPLTEVLHKRSLRTLDIFLTTLLETRRQLPRNFMVTLPKITSAVQVRTLARTLGLLERRLKLREGSVRIELMIETPQSIFDETGVIVLNKLVEAGEGRVTGAHFGTYDYTALCSIVAAHQEMTHPACDFAKDVMQVALAQTGVMLSDGATNVLPVPLHRVLSGNAELSPEQVEENRRAVHRAWRLHASHIRHSLATGYYQGWDLHPAQLPTRYASVYAFFLESLEESSRRLKNFVEKAAQATLVGDVFDDAATGQGLLNFFLRGLNCGAITLDEARATGLSKEEIQGRSFVKILENRKKLLTPG